MDYSKPGSLSVVQDSSQNCITICFAADGTPLVSISMGQLVGDIPAGSLQSTTYGVADLDASTVAALTAACTALQAKAATDAGFSAP